MIGLTEACVRILKAIKENDDQRFAIPSFPIEHRNRKIDLYLSMLNNFKDSWKEMFFSLSSPFQNATEEGMMGFVFGMKTAMIGLTCPLRSSLEIYSETLKQIHQWIKYQEKEFEQLQIPFISPYIGLCSPSIEEFQFVFVQRS